MYLFRVTEIVWISEGGTPNFLTQSTWKRILGHKTAFLYFCTENQKNYICDKLFCSIL